MPISIQNRVVVFDYGEVISFSPGEADRAIIDTLTGVDPELFWPRYWQSRDALDRGIIDVPRYWNDIAADLGVTWSPSRVQELWVADFRSWLSINPAVFDLLAELHEGGTRLAVLSNAGFDFGSPFRFSPLGALFERVFVSAEMLMLKPDAEIYLQVAADLRVTPEEMIFIDNRSVNIEGAEAVGVTGHVFVGASELRAFLESHAARS